MMNVHECTVSSNITSDIYLLNHLELPTSPSLGDVKEAIVESFCNSSGKLRIVIGTIAFGMGLDCPSVRQIILWGPPSDFESFIQQTGRGGRDGLLSCALVYYTDADHRWASEQMMEYCHRTDICRRKNLIQILTILVLYNGHVNPVCVVMCACRVVHVSYVVVIITT